jgi:hypothetical protein
MNYRDSRNPEALWIRRPGISSFDIRATLVLFLMAAGCGAPGEPTPPSPPVLVAVTDLSAQQAGDAVQLTFTLPTKTVAGDRLADAPAIEILRGTGKRDGSADTKSFRLVETIPGALLGEYRTADKVQISNPISADERHANPGGAFAYRVRTRASRKRASAESNTAIVRIRPVPERIPALQVTVTELAVELSWLAPTRTSSGDPLPAISEYRVYRGEIDPASANAAANDLSHAKWKSPLTFLGSAHSETYRDTAFDFGKTYVYTVRTAFSADGSVVDSSDSVPAIVTPADSFPPGTPQGLVGAIIVGSPTNAPEVELSWSINTETDLAGYRVYRSERQDRPGQLVTTDLLPSPVYRDTSVQLGHTYWYSVTAVDRSGNESAHSAPVAAEVAQPSP